MTALEKALLEENERLTKMIEDERSRHELEIMNLQQDCEKELAILQTNATELTNKVKSLNKELQRRLNEIFAATKRYVRRFNISFERKIRKFRRKIPKFERRIRELTDRAQEATRICREFIEEREYTQKASIHHHVSDVCKEKTQSLDMF